MFQNTIIDTSIDYGLAAPGTRWAECPHSFSFGAKSKR